MNNSVDSISCTKYLLQIIILTILDFLVIRFCVLRIHPDPSVSIGLLFLVPAVFVINIIVAIILAFVKKQYSGLFFINSFIASILMYVLFIKGIDRHQTHRYETWEFNSHDTTFNITLSKLDATFYISYSINSGSSIGFLDGKYKIKNNDFNLMTDSTEFIIKNNTFYGFQKDKPIALTKIVR